MNCKGKRERVVYARGPNLENPLALYLRQRGKHSLLDELGLSEDLMGEMAGRLHLRGGPDLAEVGQDFLVTRERIRQIRHRPVYYAHSAGYGSYQ